MFRATHRSSSGAKKFAFATPGFTYVCGYRPLSKLSRKVPTDQVINLRICRIWLVDLFENYDDARTFKL